MPIVDMNATGKNIKKIMKENNFTIAKVQDILGFNTPQAIYKWMRGDAMPTIDNMVILANVFDTTIDNLIVTTIM